jgi:hypothetical protein
MNQDNDVERLFSWLQTPEIRYREFAGAREVTNAVVTWQTRTNTPEIDAPTPHNVQLDEEYPADQFPDQSQVKVEVEPAVRAPAAAAPIAAPPAEPVRHEPAVSALTPVPAPPPPPGPLPAGLAKPEEHSARSLDSVFNRLAGDRASSSDPRDRLRRNPGLGPTSGRPR